MSDIIHITRLTRGQGPNIHSDEYALFIARRGRVVYQTRSPIVIHVALLAGQAGQQLGNILDRMERFVAQATQQAPRDEPQDEPQKELEPQPQPQPQPQPHPPTQPHPQHHDQPQTAPHQPQQIAILDRPNPDNRSIFIRLFDAAAFIAYLVLHRAIDFLARAAGVNEDAIQRATQQWLTNARTILAGRVANAGGAVQADAVATTAPDRTAVQLPVIPEGDAERPTDSAQPNRLVEEAPEAPHAEGMEGTENQGQATGRDEPGQWQEVRGRRANRRTRRREMEFVRLPE